MDYRHFEFVSKLMIEDHFLLHFDSVLYGISKGDNLVLTELMDSRPTEYSKHCLTNRMFIKELDLSIKLGVESDIQNAKEAISEQMINNSKQSDRLLSHILETAKHLSQKAMTEPHLQPFDSISNRLEGFIEDISARYSKNTALSADLKDIPKIKWNGGVASLGTLFSELRFKYATETDKPLLEGNVADIVRLVQALFIDSSGEPFEEQSLKKYIYENQKTAKKDRVEIDSIYLIKKIK